MERVSHLQQAFTKIYQLPVAVQQQVLEYLEFVLVKHQPIVEEPATFRFDWAGSLEGEVKTSVELQHEANELR